MQEEIRLTYERGDLEPDQLNALIGEFFDSAASDKAVRRDAEEAKRDLGALLAAGPDQIRFEGRGPGLTGVELVIISVIAGSPVQSAWSEVVLPWLRRRYKKALGGRRKKGDGGKGGDDKA